MAILSESLGHHSVRVTEKHYVHNRPKLMPPEQLLQLKVDMGSIHGGARAPTSSIWTPPETRSVLAMLKPRTLAGEQVGGS